MKRPSKSFSTILILMVTLAFLSACGSTSTPVPQPATLPEEAPIVEVTITPTDSPQPESPTGTTMPPADTATPLSESSAPTQVIALEWPTPAPGDPLHRRGQPFPPVSAPLDAQSAASAVTLSRWGKGNLEEAMFSPDGRYLAVRTSLGTYLYDPTSGLELPPADEIIEPLFPAAGPPFRTEPVGVGGDAPSIEFTLLKGDQAIATLPGYWPQVFNPDYSLVAAPTYDGKSETWVLYHTADGSVATKIQFTHQPTISLDGSQSTQTCGDMEGYHQVIFSPDSSSLVFACANNSNVYILPVNGEPIMLLNGEGIPEDTAVLALATSAGGKLAAGYNNGQSRLWDLSQGVALPPRMLDENFLPLAFSPDGSLLAGMTGAGVQVRDLANDTIDPALQDLETIYSFAISLDGTQVAYETARDVAIASLPDGKVIQRLPDASDGYYGMGWSPDGQTLALQNGDGEVSLWNTSSGKLIKNLDAERGIFGGSLAFAPDGRLAIMVGRELRLLLPGDWTMDDVIRSKQELQDFAITPDGETAALLTEDGVELRRIKTGKEASTLKNLPEMKVVDLAYSPGGEYLVLTGFGDEDVQIAFYDLEAKQVAFVVKEDEVIAVSPDGSLAASGGKSERIRLWNTSTGAEIGQLSGHQEPVTALAFTPDNNYLISVSMDGSLRIWAVP